MKTIISVALLLLLPINSYIFENNYGQHYNLNQNDPVWFYVPDQVGWTKGYTHILWGYYPMIQSRYGLMEFNSVIWEIGNE